MKLFVIDGNIGSGKSTFLKHLATKFTTIINIQEPVDEWFKIKDDQGVSLFELFYKDPARYSYLFQTNILYTRFDKIKQLQHKLSVGKDGSKEKMAEIMVEGAAIDDDEPVVVCERSIMTDLHIFVEAAKDLGTMSSVEYEVFLNWYTMLVDLAKFRVDGVIYLRCDPEISQERIFKRNRTGENGIAFDYLRLLHDKHEAWLLQPLLSAKSSINSVTKSEKKGPPPSGISDEGAGGTPPFPVFVVDGSRDFEDLVADSNLHRDLESFLGLEAGRSKHMKIINARNTTTPLQPPQYGWKRIVFEGVGVFILTYTVVYVFLCVCVFMFY
jgi:deoxyadenosine/deoxycytidine kinase